MLTCFEGYLERQDCNFIAIDWSSMATGNYSDVSTNYVPLAGMLTGKFINFLVTEGATLDDFHLIGHRYTTPITMLAAFKTFFFFFNIKNSFGAHVVGFAGAAVTSGQRVARITGNQTY